MSSTLVHDFAKFISLKPSRLKRCPKVLHIYQQPSCILHILAKQFSCVIYMCFFKISLNIICSTPPFFFRLIYLNISQYNNVYNIIYIYMFFFSLKIRIFFTLSICNDSCLNLIKYLRLSLCIMYI